MKTENLRIGKKVIFSEYGELIEGTIIKQKDCGTGNFWFNIEKNDKTVVSVSITDIKKITFK